MNSFEKSQKNFSKLNASDPALQEVLDCTYPVNGDECLEKIKTLRTKIKNPIEENLSKKDSLIQDPPNSCQNTEAKSKLQEKMKTNKNEITEYTNKLSDENKEIMKKIESNQKDFATWMGVFEDRLKAITDNQAYIYNFCMMKKQ
jgi:DNA-binding transcriptional regulator YiaG